MPQIQPSTTTHKERPRDTPQIRPAILEVLATGVGVMVAVTVAVTLTVMTASPRRGQEKAWGLLGFPLKVSLCHLYVACGGVAVLQY